jgi:hypothetical protein
VTAGMFLMSSLAIWYLISMLVMWRCLRGHKLAPPPRAEVAFALQEGQTIIGVMDKRQTICFCIGTMEQYVYEDDRIT